MESYPEGRLVRLVGNFTTAAGAYQDPSMVRVVIETPTGVQTSYTYNVGLNVVKDSTGVYHVDIDTTGHPGVWLYRWYSTGTGQTATTDDAFQVLPAVPS